MTKKELIGCVVAMTRRTNKEVEEIANAMFESMADNLKVSEEINIAGFGRFTIGERQARQGFNPQTKEPITIPAYKVVKFKAAKAITDALRSK